MAQWFYAIGGQPVGPVDEAGIRAQIAAGVIGADSLIWREGMPQWLAARAVPGLIPSTVAVAPLAIPLPDEGHAPYAELARAGGPMQLAYASPVVAAAPVLVDDPGPFIKIGPTYYLPGAVRWKGTTAASPQAVYLLKKSRGMSPAVYGVGGLAGALLHNALSKGDDVRTCSVADLPQAVSKFLDPNGKLGGKDVIVIPRECVRLLKARRIGNVVIVYVGNEKFRIDGNLFGSGKVRRFLTGNGWTINQEVVPTAAPIHGHSLGRTFEEAEKHRPSTLRRAVSIILAALFIILYFVVRILPRL